MTSVAHNGFACPYCRTAMAEAPEESDDGDEEEYDEEEEEEEDMFNDYALLGFRLFQNNIIGEVHDPEDIEEEAEFEAPDEEEEEEEDDDEPKPSADIITMKLIQQGVNMEQLVKCLLGGCHQEYQNNDEFSRVDDEIFGKIRIIISNFTEQTVEPVEPIQPILRVNPIQPPEVVDFSAPSSRIFQNIGRLCTPEVDFSAQPKHIVRRIMMHV
jgi:hypothetical protein